jgi:hypothetical protein
MSAADISAHIVDALEQVVAQETGAATELVSVSVNMIAGGEIAYIDARIERKTRTLAFAQAEAFGPGETHLASATSVHKIRSAT